MPDLPDAASARAAGGPTGASARIAGLPRGVLWGAIVAAVALLLAAAACTRWPVPKAFTERWLGEKLHRTVRIEGDASVCLCPRPTLRAASIEIGAPDWSEQPLFARVTDGEISVSPLSMLRGRLRITAVTVGTGEVILERTEDGRASWQFAPPRADASPPEAPAIDRIEAKDVSWKLIDPARGAKLHGTLSLQDGTLAGRPAHLELRAQGTLRDLPVQASVEGGSVLAGAASGPQPLKADARVGKGRLEFDGQVDSLSTMSGLDGRYRVSGPALAALGALVGAVLPRTPPFEIEGRLHHGDRRWEVGIAKARVGQSDMQGEVVFAPGVDRGPTRLSGRLVSSKMRISDLGRSVGFGEKRGRSDRVLPDVPLDLPSLRGMEADLDLSIGRLELGKLAPVTDLTVKLALRGGVLALGSMKADVAGGHVTGDVRLDGSTKPGKLDTSLRITGVALQQWLPKLRGEAPIAARLNADLTLRGRGDSVADVLGRADGRLRAALGAGEASRLLLEVAGLDIAESLAVLATKDKSVKLDCGLADIRIRNGIASPDVLVIDTRDTVVTAEGSADLGKERLGLRLRAAPRDFSPLTVRAPVDVGGTFSAPQVSLDKTRIAGTVIASVVLGAVVAPIAALLPLLDFGEGDPPSPCRDRLAGLKPPPPTTRNAN